MTFQRYIDTNRRMNTVDTSSTLERIRAFLVERKEPEYRYTQIATAWYDAESWDVVSTISKELRQELKGAFPWLSLVGSEIATSPRDGTQKSLMTLQDGQKIESVFMPNARGKRTICVSSQVGCAMACTFCATGTMGMIRNLSVDEIVDQVRFWKFARPEEEISNIVFMGMGEPLANYEVVKEVVRILIDELGIGATRITVSTVGVPVILNRLLKDDSFPHVRIAFSLHAGTDETRSQIVPSHRAWTIAKIVDWMERYLDTYGNRRHHVTVEYVMLNGVNDMHSEARALVKVFAKIHDSVKLNLIPWNATGKHLERSTHEHIEEFARICEAGGITTTIRYSKGLDIEAACGQLVVKNMQAEKAKEALKNRMEQAS